MNARAAITGDQSSNQVAKIKFMEFFDNLVKRKENIIEDIESFNQIVKVTGVRPNYNVGEGIFFMPSDMILTGGNTKSVKYKINKMISTKSDAIGLEERVNYEILGGDDDGKTEREKEKEQEEEAEKEEESEQSEKSEKSDASDEEVENVINKNTKSFYDDDDSYKKIVRNVKKKKKVSKISHEDEKIGVILAITTGFALLYTFRNKKK